MRTLARKLLPRTRAIEGQPPGDQELVARIRAGDSDAFSLLVEKHWERLYRLALGIIDDSHLSEDVVQEVFVLVYRKLGSFDGRSALLTWMYRIAVNAALKARRRARRQALCPLSARFDRAGAGPQVGREREMRELAAKLLRCLPRKLRTVVVLREWQGLGYEEIGRVLGCSRGAVEQRLHRAMVELRRIWGPVAREEWFHGL